MRVGIPTEIKNNENRVAITPAGVQELTRRGHEVFIQMGAGLGSGFDDAEYGWIRPDRGGARPGLFS